MYNFNLFNFSYQEILEKIIDLIFKYLKENKNEEVLGIKLLKRTSTEVNTLIITKEYLLFNIKVSFKNSENNYIPHIEYCALLKTYTELFFGKDEIASNTHILNTFLNSKSFLIREKNSAL